MVTIKVNTATEAFDEVLDVLLRQAESGFRQPSRDGDVVGEILNAVIEISDPTRGIVQSKRRNMSIRYALGELLWYLSGSNRTKDIARYSTVWERLSDDGVTANSAYGYRIREAFGFDQWAFVKQKLEADPMDRQALIHIKDASNVPSKDIPCTCVLHFQIRSHMLYLTVYMRSNDVWTGFPYDVFAFTSLQILMAMELGVGIGSYTHIAGSLHLYERNLEDIICIK